MRAIVWLIIISVIFSNFLGYYPNFGIPPIKRSLVSAQVQEQRGEVIAASFSKPLILPHPGFLSTRFSSRHLAVDIATGLGMPIHPILDGTVEQVGRDFFGLGNYVSLSHENGFKSKYAHLGKIYVKKADQVSSQNSIGEVGITGQTSGPHTHLEITLNGNFVDPQKLLPDMPAMPTAYLVKK